MTKAGEENTRETTRQEARPSRLPTQQDASVAGMKRASMVHRFVRHGCLHPKILVICNDAKQFCFRVDRSTNARFGIHTGSSINTSPLGYLITSASLNSFRIDFATIESGWQTTDVKAKVGYPHPKSFVLRLPSLLGKDRDGEWMHRSGHFRGKADISQSLPVIYDLYRRPRHSHGATMIMHGKSLIKTEISWHIEPASASERAFLLLSAIGVAMKLVKGLQGDRSEAREFFGLSFGGIFFGGA